MEHRRLPNTSQMFGIVQDQNRRAAAAENGSFLYPRENMPMSGVYCAFQQDLDSRPVENSSSTFRLEGPHVPTSVSGPYYDPFPLFPAAGSIYLAPENNASHAHSSYHNRDRTPENNASHAHSSYHNRDRAPENNASHAHSSYHNRDSNLEVDSGLLDPMMGTGRGPFKRKSPGISVGCERGSSSRLYSAGSSSYYSEFHLEEQTSDFQNYPSSCMGLPYHRGGSFSIGGEDVLRNVRSRSRLDLGPNPRRPYLSSHSSHHYHSRTVDIANINTDATAHEQNCIAVPLAGHGRFQTSENNGLSHEMNQSLVGRSTSEIGGYPHDSVSSRNPVLPPRYLHGPHTQAAREGCCNYSQRAIPSYRVGLSFPRLGHEAAPSEHGLQFLSETSSSRYSRPSSAGGWHSNYRDGRSRIAIERFQSLSNAVDARDRMRSEALMMVDRSLLYGSRNMFDQYRNMRLDTDNMGYEELLALGERIGNVSTGLSEDVISKCLIKTTCSDENQEACAICLEEYKNKEEVATMRNCGHDYHVGCIKKWLSMKNACPICKAPAVADSL